MLPPGSRVLRSVRLPLRALVLAGGVGAGWLLGIAAVRPTFERHVAAHMASLAGERSTT
jgi:hypothetical protein